jgi:hypothetical protein
VPVNAPVQTRYIRDAELSYETSLDSFLPEFFAQHPGVKQTITIDSYVVKRQFARDIPSLVRINGCVIDGNTDSEKVIAAYNLIRMSTVNRPPELRDLIPELANQNLGLVIYERVVSKYAAPEVGLLVKQTYHHYIDIGLTSQMCEIYMLAIFELQHLEVRDNA